MKTKLRVTTVLLLCLTLLLGLVPAAWADDAGQVVLSDNLTLTNVSYEYIAGEMENNPGSVGELRIKATATGPSNVARVWISSWRDTMPSAADAQESAEYQASIWQESRSSVEAQQLPFEFENGRPVFSSDLGKTQYVILAGIDTNVNLAGYAVVEVKIPENPDDSGPDLSQVLELEDISYEYLPDAYADDPSVAGGMRISGTATGPSNLVEILIASWWNTRPDASAAQKVAEETVATWKENGQEIYPQTVPFKFSCTRPVFPDRLGTTQYDIVVGLDANGDLVGYTVVEVQIPDVNSFAVSFNSNGGSTVTAQKVIAGGNATTPADPTKPGYRFGGWYTDEALTSSYDFSAAVTADLTLYAKWIEPDFVLPASLTSIEAEAFRGSAFNFAALSAKTVKIGDSAFADCTNLWYIYIPATAVEIADNAFAGVNGLTILGAAGSTAESYAAAHGISFIAVA